MLGASTKNAGHRSHLTISRQLQTNRKPYLFHTVANNGLPVTDCHKCCLGGCSVCYTDIKQWGKFSDHMRAIPPDNQWWDGGFENCDPVQPDRYQFGGVYTCTTGNGYQRWAIYNYSMNGGSFINIAYDIFDISVNDPDL